MIRLDKILNKLERGKQAEQLASQYLIKQGLKLVEKNYRCRRGEIDLIMKHNDSLVFVEVRYRKNNDFGGAKESITRNKQNKIQTTALHYMQSSHQDMSMRFDVIAITGTGMQHEVEWIQNAF